MNQSLKHAPNALPTPILPFWIFDHQTPDCLEDAAFFSGAAISLLHVLLNDPTLGAPVELLRSRLALRAAVQCGKIEGRVSLGAEVRTRANQADRKTSAPRESRLACGRELHPRRWHVEVSVARC
ncbi:DUF1403 family protein [Roseovarius sp. M141]|uniref:DUF1403 family protein n=1 Tax=Roseovarius sp. M141 TaxID=2583806 RepID=UPI0020CDB4BE|nr:DUF1403 family protein [Roseovarius sp. M141]